MPQCRGMPLAGYYLSLAFRQVDSYPVACIQCKLPVSAGGPIPQHQLRSRMHPSLRNHAVYSCVQLGFIHTVWVVQAALGLHIVRFPEALEAALADLKPNLVADYAFNLAGAYNSFYAECQACACLWFWRVQGMPDLLDTLAGFAPQVGILTLMSHLCRTHIACCMQRRRAA